LSYFYVPISRIAKSIGISTPIIDGIVNVMGVVLQTDYWKTGVTTEELGFKNLTAKEILNYVNTGERK